MNEQFWSFIFLKMYISLWIVYPLKNGHSTVRNPEEAERSLSWAADLSRGHKKRSSSLHYTQNPTSWLQVSTADSARHTASPSAGQTFAPPPPSPRPHLSHLPHPDLSFHETTSQVQQLDPASTFLLSTPAQTLLSITSLPVSERAGYLWGYSVVSGPGVLHTQMRCRPIHLTPKG